MKLVRSLLVVALSVGFIAGPALAAVEQVSVRVDGLACPFCANNIEKRVKTIDGVARDARIVTSVEKGMATFPWKAGVAFDPAAIRKAIKEAGFSPREISVTVTGTLKVEGDGSSKPMIRLVDEKVNLVLSVLRPDRADRRESWEKLWTFSNGTTGELRVRLEGEVHSEIAGGSLEVSLQRWSPVEFGAEVVLDVEDLACEQCSTRTMRALTELEGVIHVEADHEADRVHIWTRDEAPDLRVFRERIETLGFKVTHVHTDGGSAKESADE